MLTQVEWDCGCRRLIAALSRTFGPSERRLQGFWMEATESIGPTEGPPCHRYRPRPSEWRKPQSVRCRRATINPFPAIVFADTFAKGRTPDTKGEYESLRRLLPSQSQRENSSFWPSSTRTFYRFLLSSETGLSFLRSFDLTSAEFFMTFAQEWPHWRPRSKRQLRAIRLIWLCVRSIAWHLVSLDLPVVPVH